MSRDRGRLCAALRLAALSLVLQAGPILSAAAATFTISQQGRKFGMAQITIAVGDTIHFTNDDDFTHQMYIVSPDFGFDSDEQNPGQGVDIRFTSAGVFTVQCHIHPRMALQVTVR